MRTERVALLTLCVSALFSTGCSKEGAAPVAARTAPPVATAATVKATAVAPDSKKRASACAIVTQAEMSAILGGAVVAAAGGNDRPPSSTECIYSSAVGPSPYAELEVDWGGGDPQVLGAAAGLAKGAAPVGAVDPLQGLGERAYKVTADQVFISTQGNLMMIRFPPRTGDVIAKARRIYETAKARM
ncbi:MAG: hypothetical protein ACREXI_06965 [Caldimonas sp.]